MKTQGLHKTSQKQYRERQLVVTLVWNRSNGVAEERGLGEENNPLLYANETDYSSYLLLFSYFPYSTKIRILFSFQKDTTSYNRTIKIYQM